MSDADASPPAPRRSQRDKKQVDRFVPGMFILKRFMLPIHTNCQRIIRKESATTLQTLKTALNQLRILRTRMLKKPTTTKKRLQNVNAKPLPLEPNAKLRMQQKHQQSRNHAWPKHLLLARWERLPQERPGSSRVERLSMQNKLRKIRISVEIILCSVSLFRDALDNR